MYIHKLYAHTYVPTERKAEGYLSLQMTLHPFRKFSFLGAFYKRIFYAVKLKRKNPSNTFYACLHIGTNLRLSIFIAWFCVEKIVEYFEGLLHMKQPLNAQRYSGAKQYYWKVLFCL
jgi:hypothetical protein